MATVNISYSSSATITCSVASLASSTTIGRSSTSIDNGTNLYNDVLVQVGIKTSGTSPGMDKACYIYVFGSEDGTNFDGSSVETIGTDVPITFMNPTNLKGPITMACNGTSQTVRTSFPIAQFFAGRMPRKWGVVVRNFTGFPIDPNETSHTKTYTGIKYTVL